MAGALVVVGVSPGRGDGHGSAVDGAGDAAAVSVVVEAVEECVCLVEGVGEDGYG